MARLSDVVFDCRHAASLARFWAAALDGYEVAAYDDAELERLRARGIASPEDDPTVLVEALGVTPRLWFQEVPEPKAGKNRVHLDLRCDDLTAETHRLVALGATVVAAEGTFNEKQVVLYDPEDNELYLFG